MSSSGEARSYQQLQKHHHASSPCPLLPPSLPPPNHHPSRYDITLHATRTRKHGPPSPTPHKPLCPPSQTHTITPHIPAPLLRFAPSGRTAGWPPPCCGTAPGTEGWWQHHGLPALQQPCRSRPAAHVPRAHNTHDAPRLGAAEGSRDSKGAGCNDITRASAPSATEALSSWTCLESLLHVYVWNVLTSLTPQFPLLASITFPFPLPTHPHAPTCLKRRSACLAAYAAATSGPCRPASSCTLSHSSRCAYISMAC